MAQIRTHYDNLKVARNAPPEVIRAAYKTLSQKYHPDRNPGNPESVRIMTILNNTYDVLSDPSKRREHDEWIALQERMATEQEALAVNPPQPTPRVTPRPTSAPQPNPESIGIRILFHVLRYWFFYVSVVISSIGFLLDNKSSVPHRAYTPPAGPKPYQAIAPTPAPTVPEKPKYVRPSTAPNGQPWPASANYVDGYINLNDAGLSTVTVDNSRNDSDVFVKLVSLDGEKAFPVRQFYIPAFGSFLVDKVTAGSYDVRYRDLSTGGLSRSEAFKLKEITTYEGTQFSEMTLTLYKVQNGNMQTFDLAETEF